MKIGPKIAKLQMFTFTHWCNTHEQLYFNR